MSAAHHLLKIARAAHEAVRELAAKTPLRLGVFSLVALAATWKLLSTSAAMNDFRDAHVLAHYETIAAASLSRFHQLPLWDPYYCGGMYLLGTPQARFVSPTLLSSMLFGEARGEAITAFAMLVVGLEGTFRYARARGATHLAATLAAPIFALLGTFAYATRLGWINFYAFELLPWAGYGLLLAMRGQARGVAIGGAALAWCVGLGGTYAAPMAALWCGFEVVENVLARLARRRWRAAAVALGGAAVMASIALGLSALRLWPVAETLRDAPRIIGGTPGPSTEGALKMLFMPMHGDGDDGSIFVGVWAIPAVLFGLARLRSIGLAAAIALSTWLAFGYTAQPSLFAMLRELPIYETLRYPERFFILAALASAVLAARGVTTMEALARSPKLRARRPKLARLAAVLGAIAGIALLVDSGPLVAQHVQHALIRANVAPPGAELASRPFHQARGNRWALGYYEPMNRGSLSCWDAYPVPQSPKLRGDLGSEEYPLEKDAGKVTEASWSPNAIDLDVALTKPTRVMVNQNFHAGWRSNVGEVVDENGLLAVELPAGTSRVELRFAPASAKSGFFVTLASLLALVGLVRFRRYGARAFLAAAIVPPLAALVASATLHDASAQVRVPRAPDGGPVIVDALPPSALRLDAKYESGVSLEAASISDFAPAVGQEIMIELDWRRARDVEKALGVFVHIQPETGDTINGDHVLLSSVITLDDAPPEKTLRDLLPVTLPESAQGKTYKVWVGLWRVRHGATRVRLTDHGHAIVDDDRVLAGTITVR